MTPEKKKKILNVLNGNHQMLLNTRDTAMALCISERTLWNLTKTEVLPHLRIGRRVLYDPCDLQRWIDSQKRGGESDS